MKSTRKIFFLFLNLSFVSVATFLPRVVSSEEAVTRLIMTGDIMLSREVAREIKSKGGQSPWQKMQRYFVGADWLMGNFEGSVGEQAACDKSDPLCFSVSPEMLPLVKDAGFRALSIENNHSADLGEGSRQRSRNAIINAKMSVIDFDHSPGFFKSQGRVFAFISLSNLSGKDGFKVDVPSVELRQKIRLAKSLSEWVIVNVHWGAELADWPQPSQRTMATWLIDQGADVVIGHHPHVIQPPQCVNGKPVFFSLGNHVFDQKYPETKKGLMADCRADASRLVCAAAATETPTNSAFPDLAEKIPENRYSPENCGVQKTEPLTVDGYRIRPRLDQHQFVDGEIVLEGMNSDNKTWTVVAKNLLEIDTAHFKVDSGPGNFLVTLESHHSGIDQEVGPRPYVYQVTPHGLVAKWRGSALAWPIVDTLVLHSPKGDDLDYLCVLHRNDSFITLNPNTKETRVAVYSWNGFGFSGVEDMDLNRRCAAVYN